jgi:hypothetical protein
MSENNNASKNFKLLNQICKDLAEVKRDTQIIKGELFIISAYIKCLKDTNKSLETNKDTNISSGWSLFSSY